MHKSDYRPAQVNNICNIAWVLEKKYGVKIQEDLIETSILLWEAFQDNIDDYYIKIILKPNDYSKFKRCTEAQAFKEQKARGFIHINDFEDFDIEYDHIKSIIDRDYYYPMNLAHTGEQYAKTTNNPGVYGGSYSIGVRHYTMTETAQDRKDKIKYSRHTS